MVDQCVDATATARRCTYQRRVELFYIFLKARWLSSPTAACCFPSLRIFSITSGIDRANRVRVYRHMKFLYFSKDVCNGCKHFPCDVAPVHHGRIYGEWKSRATAPHHRAKMEKFKHIFLIIFFCYVRSSWLDRFHSRANTHSGRPLHVLFFHLTLISFLLYFCRSPFHFRYVPSHHHTIIIPGHTHIPPTIDNADTMQSNPYISRH